VESLKLCAAAGMVRVGTVALDGTKLAGNAADKANRTVDKLEAEVAEILRQAAETDQREDREHGQARGDELPDALASKAGRLARLHQAKAQLEAEAAAREQAHQQRVAAHAAAAAAKGTTPRMLKRRPQETPNPAATANVTDPDSRFLHTRNGTVQGYNAQAVTTLEQVIVAAELTDEANDIHQLDPVLHATAATLAAAGIDERPEAALADSDYWSIANLTTIPDAPELYPAGQARPSRQAPQGRQAVGVPQRRAPRCDEGQRRRQGPLRQAPPDRGAGLRSDQRAAGRPPVPASRHARLQRRVEALVRHPQPAQALTAHDHPASSQAGRRLSDRGANSARPRPPPPTSFLDNRLGCPSPRGRSAA
jgi:hypothetical protein